MKVKEKKIAKYSVDSNAFNDSLCAKLGNTSTAVLFDIILPLSENNSNVESEFNISNFEEVVTTQHIFYESDPFINLQTTIKSENISESDIFTFLSPCIKETVEEIEVRTKGQHENSLWLTARTGRNTATTFHDIKTRKQSTKPDKMVNKVLGHDQVLAWGRKHEPIAKKRYIAFNKLKEKQAVHITEMGLVT